MVKIYQFNLSNITKKLSLTQIEMSLEIMKSVVETVFNKFEEVFLKELENTELPNSAEHLYPNKLDLNLNILNIVDFQSPIFHSNGIHFNNNKREIFGKDEDESSNENEEYDASEIITNRLERMHFI